MFSSSARQPLYLRGRAEKVRDGDRDGSGAVLSLPAAHPQLLSRDAPVFADLKGYDHTFGRRPSVDASSYPPQKTSAKEGRGESAWLLGFASLDDTFAPDLVQASSSESEGESDEESVSCPPPAARPARKAVSFASAVKVQPIPHASALSPRQRQRMYTSSLEIRRNKRRNKKEFRYDGYDWRNAAEERDMGVCQVTGELVHPAHAFELAL